MPSRRGLRSGVVLAVATLLFVAVIVALVLLSAIVPGVVLFGIGLAVIAAILLYLFRRGQGADSGDVLWRY